VRNNDTNQPSLNFTNQFAIIENSGRKVHPKLLIQSGSVRKMVCTMVQQKMRIWHSGFHLGYRRVKMSWHPIQLQRNGFAFKVIIYGAPKVPIT
jgi:hypothetical protein